MDREAVVCIQWHTIWSLKERYNATTASQADREIITLESERHVSTISLIWNLKYDVTVNTFMQQNQTHRHRKQTYVLPKGDGDSGGIN